MRNVIIIVLMAAFGAMTAFAGETVKPAAGAGCCSKAGASMTCTQKAADNTDSKNPHAGCPMGGKAEAATTEATKEIQPAQAIAVTEATDNKVMTTAKKLEVCPDVKGQANLNTFHEVLHPMHVALKDGNFDEMRKDFAALEAAAPGIETAQCPMTDKCPPDCMKVFESKKANLLKAIDEVGYACKGSDNKKLEASFNVMHEAYINFASMCKQEKPAETKQ